MEEELNSRRICRRMCGQLVAEMMELPSILVNRLFCFPSLTFLLSPLVSRFPSLAFCLRFPLSLYRNAHRVRNSSRPLPDRSPARVAENTARHSRQTPASNVHGKHLRHTLTCDCFNRRQIGFKLRLSTVRVVLRTSFSSDSLNVYSLRTASLRISFELFFSKFSLQIHRPLTSKLLQTHFKRPTPTAYSNGSKNFEVRTSKLELRTPTACSNGLFKLRSNDLFKLVDCRPGGAPKLKLIKSIFK